MPLCCLRRPAFLVLLVLIAVLTVLHERGALSAPPVARAEAVKISARVASPLREDLRGRKVLVESALGKLLVYLPRGPHEEIRPGQTLKLEGALRPPRAARNPGEFDEQAFLSDIGVAGVLQASWMAVSSAAVPAAWLPWTWAESVRRSMEDCFQRLLPIEKARLADGLTLGDKGPLKRETNLVIQDAGVMHLLVPSGAKVAFVLMAVLGACRLLSASPATRFWSCALVGGFYTLMVGGEAPYARAYLGALVLLGAPLAGRDPGAFQALTLSALAILIHDPRQLFSAGFQMTYVAVAGLVLAMPSVNAALPRAWPRRAKKLAALLCVSVIVQLTLWPLFCQIFGRGSLIGLLANLVLIPISGFLMAAAFLAWATSRLPSQEVGALLLERLLGAFLDICRFFAGLPGAAVELSPMSGATLCSYYLFVFALLVLPRTRAAAALAAAGFLVWSVGAWTRAGAQASLSVLVLDLPRRPAAVVTFQGERWLIGPGAPAGAVLKALKARGVTRLDRVIVLGPKAERSLPKLLAAVPSDRVHRLSGRVPLRICRGAHCFEFEPDGTRLRAGFSIIALHSEAGAVEASTDGAVLALMKPQ